MSFKLHTLALVVGMACCETAYAAQPKAFGIRCTTAQQAQVDSMSAAVGKSVNSPVKANIFGPEDSKANIEDRRKTAISSLRSASVIVFGHDPEPAEYRGWILALQHDLKFWDDDFDFTQGVTFLKSCLRTFAGETVMGHNGQEQTIDAAFWQARGRQASAEERAAYLPQVVAGKAWYATIVLAEKQKAAEAGEPAQTKPIGGGRPQFPGKKLPGADKP